VKRKYIIALFLSCIILFPLLFSGSLQIFQQYIKYRATERLETETLVSITIPLNKVKWIEEGREIMADGKMFDIKSYSEKDGNLVAVGVYDEKETRVMELLNNFNDKQQNNFIINLFLLTQTFIAVIYFLLNSIQKTSLLKHFSFIVLKKPTPFHPQFYLPPRWLFNN